ncbi:MAG: GDYXXLXY domain-containing protein [bacterium]|nr:GDYXXLXY domain-containing protein [bacterium]
MKPFSKKAFIAVVIAQALVLCFMIGKRVFILKTGTKVLLQCEPVDPRSLFSGDYVILNYKISSLSGDLFIDKADSLKKNDTVFVALGKDKEGKFWEAKAASSDRDALNKKDYPVVIRGTVKDPIFLGINIRYGVESYFVPQYEGLEIERELSQASVEISIAGSGESGISRLFLDDREVNFY